MAAGNVQVLCTIYFQEYLCVYVYPALVSSFLYEILICIKFSPTTFFL